MRKNPFIYGNWQATLTMAALTVAYLFLFSLPGMKAIREMRDEIRAKEDMVLQAGQLAWQFQACQSEHQETQKFVEAWAGRAPSAGEVSAVFGRASELAHNSGSRITRFEPQPAVEYETLSRIPLDLGCQGSLPELFRFLRELETLPVPLWVEHVRLEALGDDRQSLQCDLNVAIFADKSDFSD